MTDYKNAETRVLVSNIRHTTSEGSDIEIVNRADERHNDGGMLIICPVTEYKVFHFTFFRFALRMIPVSTAISSVVSCSSGARRFGATISDSHSSRNQ